MNSEQRRLHRIGPAGRVALRGAVRGLAFGGIAGIRGLVRGEFTPAEVGAIICGCGIGGTVMAAVLHVMGVYRSRSVWRYFMCWSVAGIAGTLIATVPWLRAEPKAMVVIVLLGGGLGGPILGAWYARERVRGY